MRQFLPPKLLMRARRDKLMDAKGPVVMEDVQVAAKARRRTYTAEYKRRIVKEADACTTPGAVGALLRREGLFSSHLAAWRGARDRGELAGLAPKKRGRKASRSIRDRKIPRSSVQRQRCRRGRSSPRRIVVAQKKVAALWPGRGRAA